MTLLGVGGGICQDPPAPRLGRGCTRAFWPTVRGTDVERSSTNVHSNFKIKFQTYTFQIILKDNFLRLMFAYTTSDVYLTLRFKFWHLSIKFSWNYYLSMALNKQCCWWPIITFYTVCFDYQIFVVHHEIFEIMF